MSTTLRALVVLPLGRRVLPLGRRLFIGVMAAYIGTSLTLGGTRAARPVFHALAIAWALSLGWYYRRRRPAAPPPGRFLRGLELLACNLVLTLVLAELTLRVFAAWAGTSLVVSDALDSHRLVPGQDYGAGLRGNRLGYPGADFQHARRPGVRRIAALGDSFAVGPAVPFADNYLTLLGAELPGIEVQNFGVSGAGPREYRTILNQHVWTYRPDLVLVSVFVGNDITETLATPRHMDPRQHALVLLLTRGWRLIRERWRQPAHSCTAPASRLPPRGLSPQTFREVEGRRLAVCLKAAGPALEKKWQRALADLDRLIADCRHRGVPVAVVLIPDEFQVNPAVLKLALDQAGAHQDEVDLELPQRRLAAFFARRGVPCLDLKPSFATVPNTYAPRDTHWNRRGNRLAADRIGTWLKENPMGGLARACARELFPPP